MYTSELTKAIHIFNDHAENIVAVFLGYEMCTDFISFLETRKELNQFPVLLLYEEENTHDGRFYYSIKNHIITDSICLPLNPYAIKRRLENLIEYFQQKKSLEELVRSQTEHILEQNNRLRQQQEKITNINNDMLETLSTIIEYRDVESGKHIFRIRKFTEILLRAVAKLYPEEQLTEEKIRLISSASAMHDVGKIAIPDSILLSPKRLTSDEFKLMKTHTTKGCEILESIDNIEHNEYYTYCYQICRYHHEKWDGMGYPDGLSGDEIPLCAQVVSVADCYDALTSKRPYKQAYSHEKAVDMIRSGACGSFSEKMMECFSTVLPQFKEWAERYADGQPKSDKNPDEEAEPASVDAFYAKMSRNDLIAALEHQKQVGRETHKRDCDIIYRISDLVFECNLKHDNFYDRKDNWTQFFEYCPKNYMDALAQLMEYCHYSDRQSFLETFRMENLYRVVANNQKRITLDCRMKLYDNEYKWVHCTVLPFWNENEKKIQQIIFTGLIFASDTVIFQDRISEQCEPITGLWNMAYMDNLVNDYLEHSGKNGTHAVLYISIDNFKKINMMTGEKIYKKLLNDIAAIIRKNAIFNIILGKGHADNFVAFVKDCPDKIELISAVEYLYHSLKRTYTYGDIETPCLSLSIGIALYPTDGSNFAELSENAGCAAEYAGHNGSNMYLFYTPYIKSSWNLELYSAMVPENETVQFVDYHGIFCPIVNIRTQQLDSYELYEVPSDFSFDEVYGSLEDIYDISLRSDKAMNLSIHTLKNLIRYLHEVEQKGYTLPPISLYTIFFAHDSTDTTNILSAMGEILNKYPLLSKDVCLYLPQDLFAILSLKDIVAFVEGLRALNFKVGVFCFGMNTINIKCLTDRLFDCVVFSENFVSDIANGVYPIELLTYLIEYFSKLGTKSYLPERTPMELITILAEKTDIEFFIHAKPYLDKEQFLSMLCHETTIPLYPILEHTRSEIVLAKDMYNEILEKTHCVIFEWNPTTDAVRFSESYEKIYHAKPMTKNFLFAAQSSIKIHKDDRKSFVEKLISAKEGNACNETLVRFRMGTQKDQFRLNKVKLVPVKNDAGLTTKVIGIMMDISEEKVGDAHDKKDRVTTLYSRQGAEKRIKVFLNCEGINAVHAMFALEIENIRKVSELLGTIFYEAVLKENALKIKEIFRDSDIIGRMDGGVFIIFLKNIHSPDVLKIKAQNICEILKNSYQFNKQNIDISACVGVSVYPTDGTTYEELYNHAINALSKAKHNKNKWQMFNPDTSSETPDIIK
ncbi:MAG: diguanylate cyclase domain-containing protein [Acutalibacteraceae bacterium]